MTPATRAVWEALQELLPEGEGAVSSFELMAAANVSESAAVKSLRRLEAMGFISSEMQPRRRPRRWVTIEAKGLIEDGDDDV